MEEKYVCKNDEGKENLIFPVLKLSRFFKPIIHLSERTDHSGWPEHARLLLNSARPAEAVNEAVNQLAR